MRRKVWILFPSWIGVEYPELKRKIGELDWHTWIKDMAFVLKRFSPVLTAEFQLQTPFLFVQRARCLDAVTEVRFKVPLLMTQSVAVTDFSFFKNSSFLPSVEKRRRILKSLLKHIQLPDLGQTAFLQDISTIRPQDPRK